MAKKAGVSVSTVSRALSGAGEVSEATRARVVRAAGALNYVPNRSAQGLRATHTKIIGVVVPSMSNPIYERYLRGAAHEATEHGFSIFICDAEYDTQIYRTHLRRLLEYRVDGVVVGEVVQAPDLFAPFKKAGIPLDPPEATARARPPQLLQGAAAFGAAYDYLFSLGHQRVAYVRMIRPGMGLRRVGSQARYDALVEAASRAGLPDDAVCALELLPHDDLNGPLTRLLAGAGRPTALVVTAPLLQSSLVAVRNVGLKVPRDLSILLVGEASWAVAMTPPIASVSSDMYELGRRAVRRIVGRVLDRPDLVDRGQDPDVEFLPRESLTSPARSVERWAP